MNSTKKYLFVGLGFSLLASYFFVPHASWLPISLGLAASLMAFFFSRERIEDERIVHLKLKALQIGFWTAFLLSGIWVYRFDGATEAMAPLSAFDYIIATLVVASGLFRYWRWQDGREVAKIKGA